jgi:hypothetical protein
MEGAPSAVAVAGGFHDLARREEDEAGDGESQRGESSRRVGQYFFLSVRGARKPAMESSGACIPILLFFSIGKRLKISLAMET